MNHPALGEPFEPCLYPEFARRNLAANQLGLKAVITHIKTTPQGNLACGYWVKMEPAGIVSSQICPETGGNLSGAPMPGNDETPPLARKSTPTGLPARPADPAPRMPWAGEGIPPSGAR